LTPAERDRAVAIFRATASELGFRCTPTSYSIITDSYDPSPYERSSCRAEGHFTEVQLAQASDHLTVEVHQIGGISEPSFFKQCRIRFRTRSKRVPRGRVKTYYPHRWGTGADHRHSGGREVPPAVRRVP
jgi:hypothetical protein